ncbi:hypothetical protein OAL99_02630 [Gammaproteobacteria bacterium]|nr:hypothetical protein [Gammaproteobacteria bacterium]
MANRNTLLKMLLSILLIMPTLFSLSSHASSQIDTPLCDATSVEQLIEAKTIKHLNISTPKSKKWAKNYFKALKSPSKNITKKYKKKFKASIEVLFENGVSCNFSAKIRINGDWKDHITSAPPIASLDVKLLDGNINSSVKFKLFLPHTRGGDNEVFATALLRELNFLAPKTYRVSAVFNDQKTEFLFQEKIVKEFIEKNNLREATILEGDERFTHDKTSDIHFNLARVVNTNWAKKGLTSLDISRTALSRLNKAYLGNLLRQDAYQNNRERFLPIEASSSGGANEDWMFKSIMLAMGAKHGIATHNRKFYYDPIYTHFKPIYYDGHPEIEILSLQPISLSKKDLNSDEILGAKFALKAFEAMDRASFYSRLKKLGLRYSINEIDGGLNKIIANLKELSISTAKDFKNQYTPFFSQYRFLNTNKKIVFSTRNNLRIEICNLALTSCYFDTLSLEKYAELLHGDYSKNSDSEYIFVGNKQEYMTNIDTLESSRTNVFNIENDVQLTTYGSMKVLINQKERKIELSQSNIEDRALISGGSLKDWDITFSGATENIKSKQRFNQNLLTGCLTLLDMSVDNINIKVEQAMCEDGVNFMRVKGHVNDVLVHNVASDAIDVDFSMLYFKDVKVKSAGNDCVDFSAGDYKIQKAYLAKCNDKAISVGEESELVVDFVKVLDSDSAVVAKDSSIVEVAYADINNVPICFSAYNKKQEFWGAKIMVGQHNCQSNQNFQQKGSSVEFL